MAYALKYDLAVVGGGSGGLSVAAAAAQFGQKVVLFEKGEMGGDCLNAGCIPSKSLIAAAKIAQAQRASAAYGIKSVEPDVDYAAVMDRVAAVIKNIAPIDSIERFEGLGVSVIKAHARFTGTQTLEADGKRFQARRIVIATGSRAAVPDINGLQDVAYFTNETLFKNRVKPSHLIIIGGGPIGLEMAQAHRRLGCSVTLVEAHQPLAKDDPELAAVVLQTLREEGVVIHAPAAIAEVKKSDTGIDVILKSGPIVSGSHLLVAAGRKASVDDLNLEAAGVAYTAKGITVDQGLKSSNRKIYAVGDVAGSLQFTHVAGYHAGLVIRNALFRLPVKNQPGIIPWVTYADPELAQVGLQEAQARDLYGDKVKILRAPFADNDRAQTEGKTKGFIKIVLGPGGRIMGVGIVGAQAGELIAPFVLAIVKRLKISAFANLVLPYPTLSEIGKRAAVSHYAGLAKNPWVRRLLGSLKLLG